MEEISSLIILFDLNSYYWMKFHHDLKSTSQQEKDSHSQPKKRVDFEEILEMTILHIFAHLSQSTNNKVKFICFDEETTKVIFPIKPLDEAYVTMMDFCKIRELIFKRILEYIEIKDIIPQKYSKIIKALGKSLCTLNKQKLSLKNQHVESGFNFAARILVLFNSQIPSDKFKEMMSCIFVCQHRGYIIDALVLNSKTDPFLLQATTKTNGFCMPAHNPDVGMMQYFLQVFNLRIKDRENFKMPNLTYSPFNASCECHNKQVDLAWTCSVCLGIYCQSGKEACKGICRFCSVRYDLVDFNQRLTVQGE